MTPTDSKELAYLTIICGVLTIASFPTYFTVRSQWAKDLTSLLFTLSAAVVVCGMTVLSLYTALRF